MIKWIIDKLNLITHDCYRIKKIERDIILKMNRIDNIIMYPSESMKRVKELEFVIDTINTSFRSVSFENLKSVENLVDRVTQLESTVQCLSDENQKLMGMIYNKSTVNEILKGE